MSVTLKIGGPPAIRCEVCDVPPGMGCKFVRVQARGPGHTFTRAPHAARVKAAPPEQEAKVGDLVVVQLGARETLALVRGGTQDNVALRFWSAAHGWSPGDGHLEAWRILRLAPEDETTAAMRATLAAEGRAA